MSQATIDTFQLPLNGGAGELGGCRRGCKRLAQPDEQRLERQWRRDLELLGLPPRGSHELARVFRSVHPLERGVALELGEPVDVDGGSLSTRGDDDEVAVPGLELFEQREQL